MEWSAFPYPCQRSFLKFGVVQVSKAATFLVSAAAAVGLVIATPATAFAQDNRIYGYAYTTWHHENYVRSKTYSGNVTIWLDTASPSPSMAVRLGDANINGYPAYGYAEASRTSGRLTIGWWPAGGKFVLWTRSTGTSGGNYDGWLGY